MAIVLAVAAALGIGLFAYWKREAPPVPPSPALESLEPAVAKAVYSARERVLSEPRSAAAWGELGEIFLANELEDEAYTCFQHADRLEPGTGRWAYLLAIVLINRGDRDAALPFLERAVEAGLGRGDEQLVPRLVLIEQSLLLGRTAEAEPHLQIVLKRKPEEPRVRFDAGMHAVARSDFPAARKHLEQCLTSVYSRRRARVLLAAVLRQLGDATRADEYQDEADQMAADWEWVDPVVAQYLGRAVKKRAAFHLAESLEGEGKYEEALRVLNPVAEEFPQDDVVQMTLGRLLAQLGDYAGGEAAVRRALVLAPNKVQPHYFLSLVLIEDGKRRERTGDKARAAQLFAEAEASARRTLEAKPDYGFAYMALGLALQSQGRKAEAATAFEDAVRCTPEHGEIQLRLAEALADLGRTKEAIPRFERALRLAPPDASWRASAEARLAKLRESIK